MSDPVSNADVEDVLSSIRRLVSSDTNSDDRGTEDKADTSDDTPDTSDSADEVAPRRADALILTSALRVNQPVQEPQPEFRHTEMSNFRSVLAADDEGKSDDTSTNLSDWKSPANDEYYEDEEQPAETPVIDFVRHNRAVEITELADDQAAWRAQVDEVEVAAQPVDVEAETVEAEDTRPDPGDGNSDDPKAHAEEQDAEARAEIWAVPPADADTEDAGSEPQEDQTDAFEEETIFATAAAASVISAPGDDAELADEADLGELDDSAIDEDVLRDLVAEIVRQELTGELGERITRNVRKLVRREIHRALMTREFE